ncbi:phospho-sugar mutase [Lactobacillus acetotolerans]|jgi:phosphoglucomutase|uniref:Phosphoglucomutase n=1 Tax=Lactobacillus acetotolerans TaxID=1600 RepID=A0A0D6A504_9LACO|nr:phospho-sugar mutase [Lactobacillus acetotolerans]QGV04351.1 phospho-sugar mutase [Lactobacillus acetotolerans]BAQ57540.1 phosphoglucomutase [Lactobacillus acetotolerans]HBG91684.1 phospho-sugar mutase [Lactobacillus acetotolerans]HCX40354.1 phospho-sugar mutase [Lactobacillus acetotolerans]
MNAEETFEEWKKAKNLPDYLQDQLRTLGKDKKWVEDAFGQDINFGTAGMRGRLEPGTNRINLFTVGRVTEGLARLIEENGQGAKKRGVAISFDSRYHSREFAEHAARILGAHGIHVYLFDDLRPTPELSYSVRHLHAFAGINITASHNAKQYNGYKVYGEDGAQMAPENADRLFAHAQKVTDIFAVKAAPVKELRANGTLQLIGEDVDEDYLNELKNVNVNTRMIKENADKLKIIYTPLHGTGKMLYDRAFREGGFDNVIPVPSQSIIDPEFPTTIKPNPEFRDVFDPGVKLANKKHANVIIATDPDADRMGACVRTENGDFQVLTGNQIATLMAYYLLVNLKQSGKLSKDYEIVTSVVSSALPFKIAKDFGVKTKYVLTGFKYIGEEVDRMNKTHDGKFLMGFEESYGYLFKPFARDKDAMQGALMFAEVATYYASRGMTVFDGLKEIWQKYGVAYEITDAIPMPGIGGQKKMAELMTKLRNEHLTKINGAKVIKAQDFLKQETFINGQSTPLKGFPKSNVLKYFLDDETWVALRPSGTEPVIKAYVGVNRENIDVAKKAAEDYQKALAALLK